MPEIKLLPLATGLLPHSRVIGPSLMPGGDEYHVQKKSSDSMTKLHFVKILETPE